MPGKGGRVFSLFLPHPVENPLTVGALDEILPFLQVDKLLGKDVHMASQADPFLDLRDGAAVAALADEIIALQQRGRQFLLEDIPLSLEDIPLLLNSATRAATSAACRL